MTEVRGGPRHGAGSNHGFDRASLAGIGQRHPNQAPRIPKYYKLKELLVELIQSLLTSAARCP